MNPEIAILGADQKERDLWGRECWLSGILSSLFHFGSSAMQYNHESTEAWARLHLEYLQYLGENREEGGQFCFCFVCTADFYSFCNLPKIMGGLSPLDWVGQVDRNVGRKNGSKELIASYV